MLWSSALIQYVQSAVSAIGYLPRSAFWQFCAIGYLPRRAFWAVGYLPKTAFWQFCVNLSIQTILQRELNIWVFWGAGLCSSDEHMHKFSLRVRPLALKFLNWKSLHQFKHINMCSSAHQVSSVHACYQHPGDDEINAHIPAYGTCIEQEWMVHFFFFAVVMYWEVRMRIHQQKHTLAGPCFFPCYL